MEGVKSEGGAAIIEKFTVKIDDIVAWLLR
jgi:hypothetical protein